MRARQTAGSTVWNRRDADPLGSGEAGAASTEGTAQPRRAECAIRVDSVVVGWSDSASDAFREAVRREDGRVTRLDCLPDGERSQATGISDDGLTIVGWGITPSRLQEG